MRPPPRLQLAPRTHATLAHAWRTLALGLGLATLGCGDDAVLDPGDTGDAQTSSSTSADPSAAGVTTSGSATSSSGADPSTTAPATTTGEDPDTTTGTTGEDITATTTTDGSTTTTTGDESDTGSEDTGPSDTGDPPPPDPVIPGPKVKIMSFNIRVGTAADGPNHWDKRKSLVYQVFKNQDADFIGVQEALTFQLNAIDAAVPGYKRIGKATVDAKSKGPVNAIYYRKARFDVKTSNTFWLSNTPDVVGSQTWGNKFPRAVTWGRFVEKSSDYTFYVYNTHFDHVSQNSREKGAVLLAQKIAERGALKDPYVVMGDFNAGEPNLAIKFFKGNAKIGGKSNADPMRDTYRVVHPDADNVGTAHGFKGGTGGSKIDHILVPAKQKVVGANIDHFNVDGRYPSDHFPITSTVTFADKK